MTGDAITQDIARHQQIAGEFIRLAFNVGCSVLAEMNCGFVAVEGASLCPVQNKVPQLMSDGESLALLAGIWVVEDPPLSRITGIANQHPFNTAHG